MSKLKSIIKLCLYEFKIEIHSKRVLLGYLVGIVMILKQSAGYLLYSNEIGLSVNVLEPFIIAGNNYNTVMFLVLGWLLVISEAPFVNSNSTFLMYRTQRTTWNYAMILYIMVQGIFYYAITAVSSIVISVFNGYFANIWSPAIIKLSSGGNKVNALEVYFPYPQFMRQESVFSAFIITWSLCLLYGIVLALVLYVFNLFTNQIVGAVAAFLFHFLGYELMKEGYMVIIKYSLLARSVPVLLIGSELDATLPQSYVLFALLIVILIFITGRIVKYVDFKEISRGEE